MIEHHAIEQGLTPVQILDRFLAGDMAARVLIPPSQNHEKDRKYG